jgi:hypothetical protein
VESRQQANELVRKVADLIRQEKGLPVKEPAVAGFER